MTYAVKHNMSYTRLYRIYMGIRSRCNNPNAFAYEIYGGRGIRCEWQSFIDFQKDMSEGYMDGLQIDRKNTNGNYCKDNCRWTTPLINMNNRRNTTFVNGLPISDLCREKGISYSTVKTRIRRGWDIIDAINTPKKPQGNFRTS